MTDVVSSPSARYPHLERAVGLQDGETLREALERRVASHDEPAEFAEELRRLLDVIVKGNALLISSTNKVWGLQFAGGSIGLRLPRVLHDKAAGSRQNEGPIPFCHALPLPDEVMHWSAWLGDRCALCGIAGTRSHLVIDHCHWTGLERGYLCRACNIQEGRNEDRELRLYRFWSPAALCGSARVYFGYDCDTDGARPDQVTEHMLGPRPLGDALRARYLIEAAVLRCWYERKDPFRKWFGGQPRKRFVPSRRLELTERCYAPDFDPAALPAKWGYLSGNQGYSRRARVPRTPPKNPSAAARPRARSRG